LSSAKVQLLFSIGTKYLNRK